jgi:hypothetical protein
VSYYLTHCQYSSVHSCAAWVVLALKYICTSRRRRVRELCLLRRTPPGPCSPPRAEPDVDIRQRHGSWLGRSKPSIGRVAALHVTRPA